MGLAGTKRAVFDLLLRIQATSGLRFSRTRDSALQAYRYARQTVDVDCMTAVQGETNPLNHKPRQPSLSQKLKVGALKKTALRRNLWVKTAGFA